MVLAEKELNKTLEKVFASYAWEVHYRLFVLSRNKKKKKELSVRDHLGAPGLPVRCSSPG